MSTLAPVTETMPQEASVQQMSSIDNTAAQAIEGSPVNMSDKNVQGKTYSRRVVLHTTATAAELASGGKQLEIPDAEKIFSPDFPIKKSRNCSETSTPAKVSSPRSKCCPSTTTPQRLLLWA